MKAPQKSLLGRVLNLCARACRVCVRKGPLVVARRAVQIVRSYPAHSAGPIAQPSGDAYESWVLGNEPNSTDLRQQRQAAFGLAYRPLISIVTPVYDPLPEHLRAAIGSVLDQTYQKWELCLVDGGSTNPAVLQTLEHFAKEDGRIRVQRLDRNRGISGNSNVGIEMATGEYVALLDHDDLLAPFALFEVASLLNRKPDTDLVYSDHDVLRADDGKRCLPLFKPDWSPDVMLSANYITHLTVARTAIVKDLDGFRPETDGAQDWDLFLRISELTQRIAHIPRILYHWRNSPGSTAIDMQAKPYASQKQLEAISGHLARQGLPGARAFFDHTGFIRVAWELTEKPVVSIIIASNGANSMLETCVESVLKETAYPRLEIVIVNNGPRRSDTFEYYRRLLRNDLVRVLDYDGAFNYSAVCNMGARYASGELLLFLNNDIRVLSPDWLDELVLWAMWKKVGVVGAKLLAPDGGIQHAGVILGLSGFAGHVFAGSPEGQGGMFGFAEWYRDLSAVTGACMLLRRDVFEQSGGFDEKYQLCGSDVTLCLRANSLGYRVVYNPFARLEHLGSATHRGNIPSQDFRISLQDYRPFLEGGDPFFNRNLSHWNSCPSLGNKAEPLPLQFALDIVEGMSRETEG